jgi:hypothetical protein
LNAAVAAGAAGIYVVQVEPSALFSEAASLGPTLLGTKRGALAAGSLDAARSAGTSRGCAGVSFLTNRNRRISPFSGAVNVSNFLTTAALPRTSEFLDTSIDPDNFRIAVLDPTVSTGSVSVKFEVIPSSEPADALDLPHPPPPPAEYVLDRHRGTSFRGSFLRLVSDGPDDRASGDNAEQDPDNQTIKVWAGDWLKVTYEAADGEKTARVPVCPPHADTTVRGAVRYVSLDFRVAYVDLNGNGKQDADEELATTLDQLKTWFTAANALWAQACIQFRSVGVTPFLLPTGTVDLNGRYPALKIVAGDPDRNDFWIVGLGDGALAVLTSLSRRAADAATVTVYVVPSLPVVTKGGTSSVLHGVAHPPFAEQLAADWQHTTPNPDFSRVIF